MAQKEKLMILFLNLNGLSGRKFRSMLNNLIEKFDLPKIFRNWFMAWFNSLLSMYKNKVKLTCIDNWSQNFIEGKNPEFEFNKNIKNVLNSNSNLKFINKDFRKVNYTKIGKHNIYLYDGPHNFEDHFDGIKLVQPALENEYILIVDDWNWNQVRSGTLSAIDHLNLNIISKLEIRTTTDDSSALNKLVKKAIGIKDAFFVIKK